VEDRALDAALHLRAVRGRDEPGGRLADGEEAEGAEALAGRTHLEPALERPPRVAERRICEALDRLRLDDLHRLARDAERIEDALRRDSPLGVLNADLESVFRLVDAGQDHAGQRERLQPLAVVPGFQLAEPVLRP
jgi:hypothetical protein